MSNAISSTGSGINDAILQQIQAQLFKKADLNGDGKITAYELSQKSKSAGSSTSSSATNNLFSKLDSDGDGAISRLESDSAIAKMVQAMQSYSGSGAAGGSTAGAAATAPGMDSLLKSLGNAIQSGNSADANSSLASLEKLVSSAGSTTSANNPFLKDLQSIGSDLASGNTTDAQSVLKSIQKKVHGHHHHGPPPADTASGAAGSSATGATATASGMDSLLNILNGSPQSGTNANGNGSPASLGQAAYTSDGANGNMQDFFASAIKSYLQQNMYANTGASMNPTVPSSAA